MLSAWESHRRGTPVILIYPSILLTSHQPPPQSMTRRTAPTPRATPLTRAKPDHHQKPRVEPPSPLTHPAQDERASGEPPQLRPRAIRRMPAMAPQGYRVRRMSAGQRGGRKSQSGKVPGLPGTIPTSAPGCTGDPARGACSHLHCMHPALHIYSDTRSALRRSLWSYSRRLKSPQGRIT